jgi:hypothetical protein
MMHICRRRCTHRIILDRPARSLIGKQLAPAFAFRVSREHCAQTHSISPQSD